MIGTPEKMIAVTVAILALLLVVVIVVGYMERFNLIDMSKISEKK
jgi:hypothetical protein